MTVNNTAKRISEVDIKTLSTVALLTVPLEEALVLTLTDGVILVGDGLFSLLFVLLLAVEGVGVLVVGLEELDELVVLLDAEVDVEVVDVVGGGLAAVEVLVLVVDVELEEVVEELLGKGA